MYNLLNIQQQEVNEMTIGEIVKLYREEHGLSQRQFAERCGDITNGYISMLEQGKNPSTGKPIVPSIEKVASLARAMGLTLHQLVDMADDSPVSTGAAEKLRQLSDQLTAPSRSPEWRVLSEGLGNLEKKNKAAFQATYNYLTAMYPDIFTERTDDDDTES